MNQRIVLWGALGALVVAAVGGAVVMAGGDDAEGAPRLPLAMTGTNGESGAGDDVAAPESADAAAIGIAPIEYVAGDGLPALGGDGAAYRLPVDVTPERVGELAEALGLSGEPEETGDGSWSVEDGERRLDVYGLGNTWTSYTLVAPDTAVSSDGTVSSPPAAAAPDAPDAPGGGSSGNTGSGSAPADDGVAMAREPALAPTTTIVCVMAPCDPPVDDRPLDPTGPTTTGVPEPGSTDPATPAEPANPGVPSSEVPPCVPGPAVLCPAGGPILDEPVPGLPSEDEAIAIGTEALDAAGVDVTDARVTASGGIGGWYVEVEPALGGVPAPGLSAGVTVGPDGVVLSASGPVAVPEPLGDYALLSTGEAVERLNAAGSVWATGGGVAEPGVAVDGAGVEGGAVAGSAGVEAGSGPAEPAAPTTGTSQPRGKRTQGGIPGPDDPPMTPGTALPPDPTGTDPDGPTADVPATVTTVPRTTVPGDPGTPPTEPAVPPTSSSDPGGPGPTVTTGPVEPAPAPAQRITLTHAELVLIAVPSWNDTGTYLVPGYRFTDDTGVQATVAAVVDDSLLPPD